LKFVCSDFIALAAQKYSQDHETVKFDDETNIGTVSITEYAQKSLGDVVFVELPQLGSTVAKSGTALYSRTIHILERFG